MPPNQDKTLGRRLLATLEDVNALIPKVKSPAQLTNLRESRKKLLQQIGTLVDTNLDSAAVEYREATRGLQDASTSIRNALKEMESVAKAIELLAKAVDLVAKLVVA